MGNTLTKDKQIEEMARVIGGVQYLGGLEEKVAEKLIAKGYRKANDLSEEIFADIESKKLFVRDRIGNMRAVILLEDIAELKKKYTEDGK